MKSPKVREYYEYLFQSYRKLGKDTCYQYRINGSIVNEEAYYDIRSELIQRGGFIASSLECIGHNTLRTTVLVLLKKGELI